MASGGETLLVQEWVQTRLAADGALVAAATGGIHRDSVPRNVRVADTPAVVHWIRTPNTDLTAVGAARVLTKLELVAEGMVAGPKGGDLEALLVMAQRIDAKLGAVVNSGTAALTVYSCVRSEPWQPPEDVAEDGTRTNRLGGMYELVVQAI